MIIISLYEIFIDVPPTCSFISYLNLTVYLCLLPMWPFVISFNFAPCSN